MPPPVAGGVKPPLQKQAQVAHVPHCFHGQNPGPFLEHAPRAVRAAVVHDHDFRAATQGGRLLPEFF